MHFEIGRCSKANNLTARTPHRASKRTPIIPAILAGLAVIWQAGAADSTPERQFSLTTDHPGGVYEVGQPIHWRLEASGGATQGGAKLKYSLKRGGLTLMRQGEVELANGAADIEASLGEPGTLLLEVSGNNAAGGSTRVLGGAVVAPEKMQPSKPRPDDFDAFWAGKLEELAKVPANPQLVPGDSGKPGVDYWQITMDNIRGTHIRGQLARPKGEGKLPAMLVVQWAGVYGLPKAWVTDRAAPGWLTLNINAHDLPIDQAPEFYEQQSKGALKDYPSFGNTNRESSYFLRMYLSCYRAAQYLTERPDWDGKTLLVTGTSQGGMQTLVTAGLHPKITAAIACVPAGCDLTGAAVGRASGWPAYFWQGKETPQVIEASRYYDAVNFASRITCPVLVGIGLVDEVCAPAGILAAMNQVKGPKEIILLPHADHQGKNNTHRAFLERASKWQEELRGKSEGEGGVQSPKSKVQSPKSRGSGRIES